MILKALPFVAAFVVLSCAVWGWAIYENSIGAPYNLSDYGNVFTFLLAAIAAGLLIMVAGDIKA
jgi:hypothetical protein